MRRPDSVAGLSILVLVGVAYYWTTSFRAVPEMLSQNVPPTFFPRLVLAALAVSALVLLLRPAGADLPQPSLNRRVVVTACLFTVSVWLMPRLGMLATTSLIAIVIPLYWGERRKLRLGALAAGLPLALYLIFVVTLDMRLPRGIGW